MLEQPDILFNDIWSKMKEEEMQEAPKDWVPKDDKLKNRRRRIMYDSELKNLKLLSLKEMNR